MVAPSAQISLTNTSCKQFSSGTAGTLSSINYSGTTTISNANPGVFFYYDKVNASAATNNITVTERISSTNTFPSGQASYLLHVLNDSPGQVILYDANCNPINGVTPTVGPVNPTNNTYPVTFSNLPAGTYIFSVKYTPKTLVGLGVPTPTTIVYDFSSTLNGAAIAASNQSSTAIKS